MRRKTFNIIILFILFFSTGKIFAEEITPPIIPDPINIHLTITTNTGNLYDQDISVNACDSDNPNVSTLKVTAYCAILQSELPSDWNFTWAPGIFLNSLGNIAGFTSKDNEGNDIYHYWSWSLNGTEATLGLNQYELQTNDLISLTFVDPIIPEPIVIEEHHHSSGSMAVVPKKISFDIKRAFDFLISEQKENGSFGEDLYTDWTALALATTSDYQIEKNKLIKYLTEVKATDYQLTDYERHAIGLMALGLNPYNINGENYIKKITDSFDGKQFGNKDEDNDDIFALIVLQNAGFNQNDEIIKNTLDFILSKQKENGSWDNNVDMTGASLQAIINITEKNCFLLGSLSGLTSPALTLDSSACESPQNKEFISVINKAKEFLKQNQKDNGSFGNISSTAWAMEGILSLGEKPTDWPAGNADSVATAGGVKNGNTPIDYLAVNQDKANLWETAYALSVMSGKTWREIMQKFEKPILEKKFETNKTISKIKKIELKKEIIASPINAITENQKIEPVKKQNWWRILVNKIFGF